VPVVVSGGGPIFVYGLRGMFVEQINNTTGTVLYLHHDQAGSTRLLTGSTGTVTGKCTYGAYGTPTCEGTATTPLGFDGQYTSTDTGLIYMRARTYDPTTAQFLTVDPFVALTGEPYSYVADNPLNQADPTGRCGFFCIGGIVLGAVAVATGVGAVVVGAEVATTVLATTSAVTGTGAFLADGDECVTHGGIACVGAGVGLVATAGAGAVVVGAAGDAAAGATAIGVTSGGIGLLSDVAGAIAPGSASASPGSPVTAAPSCG
jgi:RHS repeat-associated protein